MGKLTVDVHIVSDAEDSVYEYTTQRKTPDYGEHMTELTADVIKNEINKQQGKQTHTILVQAVELPEWLKEENYVV